MERIGDWIQTYTGKKFYPLDPRPEEICIEDIAHSLSLQCRFAGHCRFFYSVGQHSLLVSRSVSTENAMWGLLHDAAEAYLVDLPRPIKKYSELGRIYMQVETKLEEVIARRFGLPLDIPSEVKYADQRAVMTEKRDLMRPCEWEKDNHLDPFESRIVPWPPGTAESQFIREYDKLFTEIPCL